MWERLSIGNGGWVCFESSEIEATIYVRLQDQAGRLEPTELFVADQSGGGSPLGANLLRRLPLGRIEATAQAEQDAIRSRLDLPGPDLRRAAAAYATTYNSGHPRRANHWVAHMLYAQLGASEQAPMPRRKAPPLVPPPLDLGLDVPATKPYGDGFYRQVAGVYAAAAREERAPAGAIADANGVPVTTVHRWVKQARARGFLPPGHPGKAG